jgi:Zn-dependent M28 family amino/carboxypeptidase
VKWERADARNIIGTIPGTDPELKKQTVVINGYFDSMAITPDLAPGAEAAGNCAALLSLAEYFKNRPAKYSLMFVANGAHHVALAGTRNFAAQHLFDIKGNADDKAKERIKSYRAFVGLDLTSRTDTVGIFAKSSFYNQMTVGSENILLKQYFTFAKTMYEDYARPKRSGAV